jgi:hypothetical protein
MGRRRIQSYNGKPLATRIDVPRKALTFDDVREIGLAQPGVEMATAYGKPALKVRGKLLACISSHKSAEPETLVVRLDFDQRDALLAEEPETYYITEHYRGYPSVLVRLPRIGKDELRDLLKAAWRFVTAQHKPAKKSGSGQVARRSRK